MPAQTTGWVTVGELLELIGGPLTADDQGYARLCVASANAFIHRVHPEWPEPTSGAGGDFSREFSTEFDREFVAAQAAEADRRLGALKLAAAMYNRRGSMGADYAQYDGAPSVVPGMVDAEISALLSLGRYYPATVA